MALASGCAVNLVLQQEQADEHTMESELPLHADGDVVALHDDRKHPDEADEFLDKERQANMGIIRGRSGQAKVPREPILVEDRVRGFQLTWLRITAGPNHLIEL